MNWPSLVIFLLTYAGIAVGRVPGLKLNRTGIALLGVIALMIFGGLTTPGAVKLVDWSTICLLFGLFVIAAQLRLCGLYDWIAGAIAGRGLPPVALLGALMAAAALLSAILNNDIACYIFTPIVGSALLRQRRDPVPYLIGLALAANIGAGLTLIGNAQNLLIGQSAHLTFGGYISWAAVPVLVALGLSWGLIVWLGHLVGPPTKATGRIEVPAATPLNLPHAIKGLVILGAVIVLFFLPLPKEVVALAAAAIHLASPKFRTEDILGFVDWPLLVLFIALFVLTGDFAAGGAGERLVAALGQHGINLDHPGSEIAATAVLANAIGNAPAVMLLLKVVHLGRPLAGYVMAAANSFAGCGIVTGSVANLIVVQQARTIGVTISFGRFARLGVPATLLALAVLALWSRI